MTRENALNILSTVRLLAQADTLLLVELDAMLSPAEQSTLRSFMRECGKRWADEQAFVPRGRVKGNYE